MLIRITRHDKNACLMQCVAVAQIRQVLRLRSLECYTAFQTVFGALDGSI
jgi:hypothetical protein